MKLAIIGSAGRGKVARYTQEHWLDMHQHVRTLILRWQPTELISGGSSFADHLAVHLSNNQSEFPLTLYLPCNFDYAQCKFADAEYLSTAHRGLF
jgi:hypothetical protein